LSLCWCVIGAISKITGGRFNERWEACHEALLGRKFIDGTLANWNDDPSRTFEDVVMLLDNTERLVHVGREGAELRNDDKLFLVEDAQALIYQRLRCSIAVSTTASSWDPLAEISPLLTMGEFRMNG